MQRLAAAAGSNDKIAAWDWRYYQEKLRAEKFAFDEAELKPYLQLEKIIDACFDVATRLFGVTFVERKGITGYGIRMSASSRSATPNGSSSRLFLADYFARPSKRSGAWMSALQSRHRLGERRSAMPIIYNICNFAKAAGGQAGTAVARRGEDAVPRIRPCAARHAVRRLPSRRSLRHLRLARFRRTALAALRALADRAGKSSKSTRCTTRPASRCRRRCSTRCWRHAPSTPASRRSSSPRRRWSTWPIMRGRTRRTIPLAFEAETLEEARHARSDRHAPPHAAFPACVFRRRLFGRLLFLHVVGSARRRRLRGLRGNRRSVQSRTGGKAAKATSTPPAARPIRKRSTRPSAASCRRPTP